MIRSKLVPPIVLRVSLLGFPLQVVTALLALAVPSVARAADDASGVARGLTADEVARRAGDVSPELHARAEEHVAAEEAVAEARDAFIPRVTGTARYTRVSNLTLPSLGNLVVAPADAQPGAPADPAQPGRVSLAFPGDPRPVPGPGDAAGAAVGLLPALAAGARRRHRHRARGRADRGGRAPARGLRCAGQLLRVGACAARDRHRAPGTGSGARAPRRREPGGQRRYGVARAGVLARRVAGRRRRAVADARAEPGRGHRAAAAYGDARRLAPALRDQRERRGAARRRDRVRARRRRPGCASRRGRDESPGAACAHHEGREARRAQGTVALSTGIAAHRRRQQRHLR